MNVDVVHLAVLIVEMFVYALIPALGYTTLGYKYFYMEGCILSHVLVFLQVSALLVNCCVLCVHKVKSCMLFSFFPHNGFFSVEFHGQNSLIFIIEYTNVLDHFMLTFSVSQIIGTVLNGNAEVALTYVYDAKR